VPFQRYDGRGSIAVRGMVATGHRGKRQRGRQEMACFIASAISTGFCGVSNLPIQSAQPRRSRATQLHRAAGHSDAGTHTSIDQHRTVASSRIMTQVVRVADAQGRADQAASGFTVHV